MVDSLTLAQARRTLLAAQGLHRGKPAGSEGGFAGTRALSSTFAKLQLVQIDSVNVLSRSHYLPFFSRLGPYDRLALDSLSARKPRRMIEYWAHEASFVQPGQYAAIRQWQRRSWFGGVSLAPAQERALADQITDLLAGSRPLTARQIAQRLGHEVSSADRSGWGWNWTPVKHMVERLFLGCRLGIAGRNEQFERRYTLIERVLTPEQIGHDSVSEAAREALLDELIEAAARALGVASAASLADYYRVPVRDTAASAQRLARRGTLREVRVHGLAGEFYLRRDAALPRKSAGRALLSPFDSLVFDRKRLLQFFGMHYRIGIYTPAQERVHGYYVLPFLLGESMAARVDLKADRAASVLQVKAAFEEPDAPAGTAAELAAELTLLARWLGLDQVRVADQGDLAPAVAAALNL